MGDRPLGADHRGHGEGRAGAQGGPHLTRAPGRTHPLKYLLVLIITAWRLDRMARGIHKRVIALARSVKQCEGSCARLTALLSLTTYPAHGYGWRKDLDAKHD